MKRSEFYKKVLKNKFNTVFTTKEQVENALEVFESLGMRPPCLPDKYCQALLDVYIDPNLNQWEEEVVKDQKVMERVKLREEWRNKP
jgi:hypothetical protein